MKGALLRTADRALHGIRLFDALLRRAGRRGKKLILCYHRIADRTDLLCAEGLVVRPEDLDGQLALLQRHFTGVGLAELLEHRGKGSVFAVTFDDGFMDNRTTALPILEARSLRAAFFVCPAYVGRSVIFWQNEVQAMVRGLAPERRPAAARIEEMKRRVLMAPPILRGETLIEVRKTLGAEPPSGEGSLMGKDDLLHLLSRGMEIYPHTRTHSYLAALSREDVINEIVRSHEALEEMLGTKIRKILAYPFGSREALPEDVGVIMKEIGFEAGLVVRRAFYDDRRDDRYRVPRVGVDRDDTLPRFRMKKLLPLIAG